MEQATSVEFLDVHPKIVSGLRHGRLNYLWVSCAISVPEFLINKPISLLDRDSDEVNIGVEPFLQV